ncbi:hypothetical protein JL09_g2913 [Pichia kudriavzevii]|uniref:Uncharacterized protein n=1 Tax=Pichia kudriavzevii TaxID=4909 RepID=A0A099P1A9_PICKU|nr:hypothetical protein JL09_g2913 [Pichia kudriavzevii]
MQSPSDIRAMRLAKLEALRKKQMEERKVELENDDATSKDVQQHQTIVNKTEGALPKGTYSTDHKCLQRGEQKSENVGISLERWKANELGRIFSVTLTPTDTSTSSLIYLESLRSELESDDLIGVDSPDTILTTLIFELGVRPHFSSPLQYLFKSWSTAYDSKRLLNKLKTASYSEKVEFYDEILRLCSGYASILFYEPDTFIDQPTLIDITNELVLNYNRYQDFWAALLNSIVDNQTQLEFLNEILPILTDEIDRSLDTESLSTSSKLAKLEALRKKQMEERKVELENDDAPSKDVQQHQTIGNKTEGALPKGTYSTDHKCLQRGEQKSENVGISLERWKANELGRIFSVTLTPTDTSTSSLIYLESLRSELESDDLIGVDSPDTILTTLIFELGVRPHFSSPLQYLFKSWSTAYDSKRLLNKLKTASYSEKVEFYDEILRLCSGYASILFYEPDTFIDQPTLIDITNELPY